MSGYLRRELLKAEQGQWLDIVYWQSMDAALAAAQSLMALPAAQPFIAMLDEASMSMRHLHQTRSYSHT